MKEALVLSGVTQLRFHTASGPWLHGGAAADGEPEWVARVGGAVATKQ